MFGWRSWQVACKLAEARDEGRGSYWGNAVGSDREWVSARGGVAILPGLPQGERQPPMGHIEHTTEAGVSTRGRRLGWRSCLRKGCGRRYQPSHWRQRYCRKPDCLRELRRWQAAKRQRKRRATATGREKHAQAERERRRRKKNQAIGPSGSARGGARGHAIKKFLSGRFAIGPAVSSPLELRFELLHITAGMRAAKPCVVCEIANASASPARQRPAA